MKKQLLVTSSPHIKRNTRSQTIMRDVLIALLPASVFGVINYGLSAVWLIVACVLSCVLFEALAVIILKRRQTVSDLSAVVTGLLLALTLPPTLPIWMVVFGSFVAIVLIKQLFGGIGFNLINPALGARLFMSASFPRAMTNFVAPGTDAVSTATPLTAVADANGVLDVFAVSHMDAFMGTIGGSIGEASALALLIGAIWLFARKVIRWHVPVAYIGSFALLTWIFGGSFTFTGDPLLHIMTGGLLLGALFMATDYTTTPMTNIGLLIFGVGCGILTAVIRLFGNNIEGVAYAIVLMNITVPLIDRYTIPVSFGGVKNS